MYEARSHTSTCVNWIWICIEMMYCLKSMCIHIKLVLIQTVTFCKVQFKVKSVPTFMFIMKYPVYQQM